MECDPVLKFPNFILCQFAHCWISFYFETFWCPFVATCILATFTMSRSEPFSETFKRNRPASCKAPRKIDSRDSRGASTGRQIAWTCWWLCCHAWFRGGRTDLRKSPDVDVQLSFMKSTSVFISEENKEWSESTMILLHSVTHPGKKKLLHLDCFKMQCGLESTPSSSLRKCCEYSEKGNLPKALRLMSGWFHINSVFFPRNRKHDTGILANSSLASNCSHWSSGIWMEIL